jgi:hypothetical protein
MQVYKVFFGAELWCCITSEMPCAAFKVGLKGGLAAAHMANYYLLHICCCLQSSMLNMI